LYFIEENHKKILDLIYDLSENQNLTSNEISDYLNDNGYKTVRGNSEFYPKLVWMILKKYRKRLSRIGNYEAIYLCKLLILRQKVIMILCLIMRYIFLLQNLFFIIFFTVSTNVFSKELISKENTIGSFTIQIYRYSSNTNKFSCDASLTGHKSTNDPIDLLLFNSSNDLISRIDLSLFSFPRNRKIRLNLGIKTFDKSDCMSVNYLKLVKSKN